MGESCMRCPRIYEISRPQLLYVMKPLEDNRVHDTNFLLCEADVPVYWVINEFLKF